jgi:hypothetical protein
MPIRTVAWVIVWENRSKAYSNVCWTRKEAWEDFLHREIDHAGNFVRWDYNGEAQACGFKAKKVWIGC